MEPIELIKLKHEWLSDWTDNFSESNYIGRFQFGKLYREARPNYKKKLIHYVVKIWELVPEISHYKPGDNKLRLMRETVLLRHEMLINHPGMLKMFGFCYEDEHLGAIYECKAFDSVYKLIPKDGFTWLQRIKAAVGLASVLKFLHAEKSSSFYKPFIIQNLDAANLLVDEEYNLKLCDFSFISGGFFPYTSYSAHQVTGCYGYTDVGASSRGDCSTKQDVFAFGVILLSLISKRVYTDEDRQAGAPCIYEWAFREYEEAENDIKNAPNFSLVHKTLAAECDLYSGDDASKITMLALECVNKPEHERPTMKHVFRNLRKLEVVQQNADYVGAYKELKPYVADPVW